MIENFFIDKLPIISLIVGILGVVGLGVAIYFNAYAYILPAGFLGFGFLVISGIARKVRKELAQHINHK